MHKHHYMQFGFSPSKVFQLKHPDWNEEKFVSSFLIPPDVVHQLHLSGEDTVLMVWADPEQYTNFLPTDSNGIEYPVIQFGDALRPFCHQPLNCKAAEVIRNVIVGKSKIEEDLDDRITESITWIKEHLNEQTITVEDLAEQVYLSKSRFMHLFSDQIGIPVRKYILWQRLKHALLMLSNGKNITESAHAAGFTDSSHMNRNFNAMFGITPSKIFKSSRFVQVFAC